jgi:catechol 2,3-dioxygenase-like lactoylglutathione lyase family enzyme
MQPTRIFETVLYAEDLPAAERFYHEGLGLEVIQRSELVVVFRCGEGVLLIFDPRRSSVPGRDVPSHGMSGVGHLAFAAKPEDLPAWKKQLRDAGIAIEQDAELPDGSHSLYFRDPAGHVVELAPPTSWGGGWRF